MPLAAAIEYYLVRVRGRGSYAVAHAHDDALLGAGAACGSRLNPAHWALEDAEATRQRRRVKLCRRCAQTLRERAAQTREELVR